VSREFASGFAAHKEALQQAFRTMLPALADAFPDRLFIVRPHPSENHASWVELARPHDNLQAVHEGNVIPWLLAADVLIHNGCTTSVEAHLLGRPSIAYQPVESEAFDFALPNSLSHTCRDESQLLATLGKVLNGSIGPPPSPAPPRPLDEYIEALDGSLASDRIVDVLAEDPFAEPPATPLPIRLWGQLRARQRWARKRREARRDPDTVAFQHHRFPGTSVVDLESRIERFASALGRFQGLRVQEFDRHIYEIARS
jgi:hypothetical protein